MTIRTKISAFAITGLAATMLAGCGGSDNTTEDSAAVDDTAAVEATDAPEPDGDEGDDADDDLQAKADELLEKLAEDSDSGDDGDKVAAGSLPDEWPAAIPTPSDQILIATWTELGGSSLGNATFYVADAAAQRSYLDQLASSGFTVEESATQPKDGVMYTVKSADWLMNVMNDEIDGNAAVLLVNVSPLG
ncbi:hypothetical protein [Demequina aurantiaca]|uniref:hypothetical protein n=1 Tax=Demequina aurantiaca TaxID=676200 RepID=UPI0007808814|nr:hypothetical protein [Demequina aurantiaca]